MARAGWKSLLYLDASSGRENRRPIRLWRRGDDKLSDLKNMARKALSVSGNAALGLPAWLAQEPGFDPACLASLGNPGPEAQDLLPHFYIWENWGSGSWNESPKFTHLVNNRARTQSRTCNCKHGFSIIPNILQVQRGMGILGSQIQRRMWINGSNQSDSRRGQYGKWFPFIWGFAFCGFSYPQSNMIQKY